MGTEIYRRWLLPVSLLVAGLLLGSLLQPAARHTGSAPAPADTGKSAPDRQAAAAERAAAATRAEIVDLQQRLEDEARARRLLESKVETMREQLERFVRADSPAPLSPSGAGDSRREDAASESWFDQQALVDSGMSTSQAGELKVFFEQLELERLYLRDRARRENWDRQTLRDAIQDLNGREDDLRKRLSEPAYDAYLYASGQTNRVAVTSVLESAQAGSAGIQAGDHIIRYDQRRIYNWRDLRDSTSDGNIGESVTLEIERDGKRMEFFLTRGPLGVRTRSLSVAP